MKAEISAKYQIPANQGPIDRQPQCEFNIPPNGGLYKDTMTKRLSMLVIKLH